MILSVFDKFASSGLNRGGLGYNPFNCVFRLI